MKETKCHVGFKIRQLRKKKELSREALARLSEISLHHLGRIERGEFQNIGLDALRRIAMALDVTVDSLVSERVAA